MKVKRAQVIKLATDKGIISHIKHHDTFVYNPTLGLQKTSKKYQAYHLYIVDDSEIQEGDWKLVNTDTDKLSTVVQHEKGINYYKQSKIIATTDKRIKNQMLLDGFDRIYPQPSKSFIEKYCKLGGIDEVMVELTEWGVGFGHDKNGIELPLRLKVNSHNEIAIHTIKDNWSRDEVNHILRDFSNVMGLDSSYVRSYIKENI